MVVRSVVAEEAKFSRGGVVLTCLIAYLLGLFKEKRYCITARAAGATFYEQGGCMWRLSEEFSSMVIVSMQGIDKALYEV